MPRTSKNASRASSAKEPASGRTQVRHALAGLGLIGIVLIIGVLSDTGIIRLLDFGPLILAGPVMIITGFALALSTWTTCVKAAHGRLPWIESRNAFVAAFVISSIVVLLGFGLLVYALAKRLV